MVEKRLKIKSHSIYVDKCRKLTSNHFKTHHQSQFNPFMNIKKTLKSSFNSELFSIDFGAWQWLTTLQTRVQFIHFGAFLEVFLYSKQHQIQSFSLSILTKMSSRLALKFSLHSTKVGQKKKLNQLNSRNFSRWRKFNVFFFH